MNGKERVRRAFAHEEPDRVPIFELTIDNPTAKHVLGRDNLCGFGGTTRGVRQNDALLNGRFSAYHEERVADEIELWPRLDLDVYPIPPKPLIPEIEDFVFPRLRQITDLCHRYGVPYVKHTDGNVNQLLDGMIDAGVDGFQAIEPGANMDIAQLKQTYGDRLTLIGNVDCATVLVNGPATAVATQTKQVIQAAAPGGGFLLSSSNSIHPGVRPDYYLAMLATARQVGAYPIAL